MTDAAEQLNGSLPTLIPRVHAMGLRFVEARRGFASATVPFEGNGNHFGVVYAGVIFTVAEVLGGALSYATFDPTTHYPLVKDLTIDFRRPGTTDLTATTTLDEDEIARVAAEAATGTKASFVLEAEVVGTDGTVVATTRGDYQLRPFA